MVVGFTGTRAGMTPTQRDGVYSFLQHYDVDEAHHGDCVGADAEFHDMCVTWGVRVVLHPPDDARYRAMLYGDDALAPLPYLTRNRAIVNAAGLLIATPKETDEPSPGRGQGTWSTIRYARKKLVPVRIFWPNGDVSLTVADPPRT